MDDLAYYVGVLVLLGVIQNVRISKKTIDFDSGRAWKKVSFNETRPTPISRVRDLQTKSDLEWLRMTFNDLEWPEMTKIDLKWLKKHKTKNNLKWLKMT